MAYSQDLRECVVAAVEAGKTSNREIGAIYGVSESTIEKWMARKRATGSVSALPYAGGPKRVLAPFAKSLSAEVKKHPDRSLEELCDWIAETRQVSASPSMMCRELKLLNLPVKKSRSVTRNKTRHG